MFALKVCFRHADLTNIYQSWIVLLLKYICYDSNKSDDGIGVFQEDILAKYADKVPEISDSNDTTTYQRNLLSVEVFYDDFNYEKIEEVESYKVSNQSHIRPLLHVCLYTV